VREKKRRERESESARECEGWRDRKRERGRKRERKERYIHSVYYILHILAVASKCFLQ